MSFSHDETVIPFGYYTRSEVAALQELTQAEMDQAYEGNSAPPASTSARRLRCAPEEPSLENVKRHNTSKFTPIRSGSGTRQAWVKAIIWHPTKRSCRLLVDVLIDT